MFREGVRDAVIEFREAKRLDPKNPMAREFEEARSWGYRPEKR